MTRRQIQITGMMLGISLLSFATIAATPQKFREFMLKHFPNDPSLIGSKTVFVAGYCGPEEFIVIEGMIVSIQPDPRSSICSSPDRE